MSESKKMRYNAFEDPDALDKTQLLEKQCALQTDLLALLQDRRRKSPSRDPVKTQSPESEAFLQHVMKAHKPYDEGDDAEKFIDRFEVLLQTAGVTNDQVKINWFRLLLSPSVEDYIQNFIFCKSTKNEDETSAGPAYEDVRKAFLRVYKPMLGYGKQKLENCKKGASENVGVYCQRVLALCKRVNPDMSLKEKFQYICNGLPATYKSRVEVRAGVFRNDDDMIKKVAFEVADWAWDLHQESL